VYVYLLGDSAADRGGGYTVTSGAQSILKYGSTLAMPTGYVEDPGNDVNNSADGNYLRFRNLKGASLTITSNTTLTTPNGFRAPINAIQIVAVPEPASILLAFGVALVGMLACGRRSK
jgi:hypothetical protein